MKKNVKSLEKAKEYCKEGQFTSNIESGPEDSVGVGHKRKKTRRLIEEFDESDVISASEDDANHGGSWGGEPVHEDPTSKRKIFTFPVRSLKTGGNRDSTSSCVSQRFSQHASPSPAADNEGSWCEEPGVYKEPTSKKKKTFPVKSLKIGQNGESTSTGVSQRFSKPAPPSLTDDYEGSQGGEPVYEEPTSKRKINTFPVKSFKTCGNRESISSSVCQRLSHSAPPSPAAVDYENIGPDILRIIRNQAEIKYELKEIKKKLENMESKVLVSNNRNNINYENNMFLESLPLSEVEDVEQMEETLEDENKLNDLVNILFLVGGDSLNRTINGIMKKLLNNELATKYSGQGKKKKKAFCDSTNLYKAVLSATRRRHPSATEVDVKRTVSLYLAQSKARIASNEKKK